MKNAYKYLYFIGFPESIAAPELFFEKKLYGQTDCLGKAAVSVTPFSRNRPFEPEQLEAMERAFRQACAELGLPGGRDPLSQLVAKRISELAQTGVRTKAALYFLSLLDFKSSPQ